MYVKKIADSLWNHERAIIFIKRYTANIAEHMTRTEHVLNVFNWQSIVVRTPFEHITNTLTYTRLFWEHFLNTSRTHGHQCVPHQNTIGTHWCWCVLTRTLSERISGERTPFERVIMCSQCVQRPIEHIQNTLSYEQLFWEHFLNTLRIWTHSDHLNSFQRHNTRNISAEHKTHSKKSYGVLQDQ